MHHIATYDNTTIQFHGPFTSVEAAVDWAQSNPDDDPRWFLISGLDAADSGMIDNQPIDAPFIAIPVLAPTVRA